MTDGYFGTRSRRLYKAGDRARANSEQSPYVSIVHDQIIEYGRRDEVGRQPIMKIAEDRQGRLLVANQREVFEFIAPAEGKGRGQWRRWPLTFKPDQGINTILSDSAGALWIGTWNGLLKYHDAKQTLYTRAQGLSETKLDAS